MIRNRNMSFIKQRPLSNRRLDKLSSSAMSSSSKRSKDSSLHRETDVKDILESLKDQTVETNLGSALLPDLPENAEFSFDANANQEADNYETLFKNSIE